ncbi:hypothetical protein T484DRAFT_1743319 [Baffinella frigidus]|nr:hypothetical protein T484DRAFT_1743319 [Cryptophyta sp. CCMP2293]
MAASASTQSQKEEPQQKRICIDIESRHDAPISSTTESLLKQRIEYQKTQIRNEERDENSFKPVDVLVTTETEAPPVVLDIHSLISRLPYSQMLNQVFTDDANSSVVVPVVTRAFEESFMREVIHANERSCKQFLALSHDLLRMSFTEYIMNVRVDFCPVENEFLTSQAPFLPNYDTACATLCDHVRQTCVQSKTWSWDHINSVCAASLDRISRMCRTRVISPNTPNVFPSLIPEQLHAAIHAHVVYPDPNTHNCVTPTNCVEQALHTRMLPWNMVRAQAARISAKYSDQLFPITSICEKHICIKCVLAVNTKSMLKISKLRMQTSTSKLTCANCNSDDTVLCVNVLGKLLNIKNIAYFGCHECTSLHEYNPVHPLMCTRQPIGISLPLFDPHNMHRSWTGGVETHGAMAITTAEQKRRAEDNIIAEVSRPIPRDRKHRCKWCGRVCSARSMLLLHQPSASIVSMTLCFKHMPPHHMMDMIKDTNALIRYIMASNEPKT